MGRRSGKPRWHVVNSRGGFDLMLNNFVEGALGGNSFSMAQG